MHRRQFLKWSAAGVAVCAAGAAVEGFALEPKRVSLTEHAIAAHVHESVSVVQLSDMHLRGIAAREERMLDLVHTAAPDVIVISGDAVDHSSGITPLERVLERLPPNAVKFATFGNWEHWAHVEAPVQRLYSRFNVELLQNQTRSCVVRGQRVNIAGVDDWLAGHPDIASTLAGVSADAPTIISAHCPVQRDQIAAYLARHDMQPRPIMVLSGHTHGGQVRVGGFAPLRPEGSGPYVSGWYMGQRLPLYVSRGIGTSVMPVRFGSPPEVAKFVLQPVLGAL